MDLQLFDRQNFLAIKFRLQKAVLNYRRFLTALHSLSRLHASRYMSILRPATHNQNLPQDCSGCNNRADCIFDTALDILCWARSRFQIEKPEARHEESVMLPENLNRKRSILDSSSPIVFRTDRFL